MLNLEIVYFKLKDIHPYERNPRRNDQAVEATMNSIQRFGFKVPIVVDKDGIIVAGHTRYKASKKLHLKEVPCVIADDLSEEEVNAFRLADNKTGELAEWDDDLLKLELDSIKDIDMADFGFLDMDLEEEPEEEEEEQEVKEDDFTGKDVESVCKPGDLWQLGDHRLICGDSTDSLVIERLMGGRKPTWFSRTRLMA